MGKRVEGDIAIDRQSVKHVDNLEAAEKLYERAEELHRLADELSNPANESSRTTKRRRVGCTGVCNNYKIANGRRWYMPKEYDI